VSSFSNIIGAAVKLTSLPLCMRCGRAVLQRVWPKTNRSKAIATFGGDGGEGVKEGEWWWAYFANKNSAGTKLAFLPLCMRRRRDVLQRVWPKTNRSKSYGHRRR
jgi:hypothetical protein